MEVHPVKDNSWAEPKKNVDKELGKTTSKQHLFAILKDFCDETTMHGLGQVARHKLLLAKWVWFLAVLVAFSGIIMHLTMLLETYTSRPVQETTNTVNGPVVFPGVTICNLDPISRSNYDRVAQNKSSRLSKFLNRIKQMHDEGVINSAEMKGYEGSSSIRMNIGSEEAKEIGHQLSDLVLKCRFRGQSCNLINSFRWMENAILYNCYTFDGGEKADNFVATGPENGLSLLLYLEATNGSEVNVEYNPMINTANALGMKVMIHPRGIYPIPHIEGMEIMPGHSTSVSLQVSTIHRLPDPYGDCINNDTLSGVDGFSYSTTPCLDICLQERMIDRCQCMSVFQPILDRYGDDVFCGTLPVDEDLQRAQDEATRSDNCSLEVWFEFGGSQELRDACGCRSSCSEVGYTYSVTESRWPAPKFYKSFVEKEILARDDRWQLKAFRQLWKVIEINKEKDAEDTDYDFIGENFARLNVYLKDLVSVHRYQKVAYSLTSLFSDIGGTLGLWIGLSLVTIVELIQLAIRVVLSICARKI